MRAGSPLHPDQARANSFLRIDHSIFFSECKKFQKKGEDFLATDETGMWFDKFFFSFFIKSLPGLFLVCRGELCVGVQLIHSAGFE